MAETKTMSVSDAADLYVMIETFGMEELFEQIAMACREMAEGFDDAEDAENGRVWRVRGNGVMQALRFYQAFVKAREA